MGEEWLKTAESKRETEREREVASPVPLRERKRERERERREDEGGNADLPLFGDVSVRCASGASA